MKLLGMKYFPVLRSVKENENHFTSRNPRILFLFTSPTQRNVVKCKTWIYILPKNNSTTTKKKKRKEKNGPLREKTDIHVYAY